MTEYRTQMLVGDVAAHTQTLNSLANDGWRLVSVVSQHPGTIYAYLARETERRWDLA